VLLVRTFRISGNSNFPEIQKNYQNRILRFRLMLLEEERRPEENRLEENKENRNLTHWITNFQIDGIIKKLPLFYRSANCGI